MASAPISRAATASGKSSRPRPPQRTLSQSLRQYSSPLIPRFRRLGPSRTLPTPYTLSPSHEATETDPLLEHVPEPIATSQSRASFGPKHSDGHIDEEVYGDDPTEHVDLEAEQSDEQADSDGLYPPHSCWTLDNSKPSPRTDPFSVRDCDVFGNIHRIRQAILDSIDDPYSLEQLKAPRMNISVVRPLVDKLYDMQDLSIIYCLLVNRTQFIREQSYANHRHTVNLTRALLCELLAEKVLRRYNEFNYGPRGLLKLAHILVAGFEPFQGASPDVLKSSSRATQWAQQTEEGQYMHKLTALEIAIVSESKSFLSSTACQKVVDAIYRGKIVYSPSSFIDILPDRWKRRPISLYDPRRAPILNQYRLIVPRTRNWMEVLHFVILLVLYIVVMTGRETRQTTTFTVVEAVFDVYTLGWVLDQLASCLEHGWHVYTQNLWSFLDIIVSGLFLVYFGIRMHGLTFADEESSDIWAVKALDVLSCAAPFLVPRLAFNVMSENMLFLSLRAMMGDFVTLTMLAIWCFGGFLLSLKWLHNGLHQSLTISKWMIWIWFGLDGTGIEESPTFHPYLGPALMIAFAFLGNTLFLTILVSMLSNTFSMISANAVQEIQYRRAVLTFMGVKSDALFAFFPPFNIAALLILGPMKWVLTPRQFHTVNVAMVRALNLPILILLSWYERKTLWVSSRFRRSRPKKIDWKNPTGPRVISTDWWSQTLQLWDLAKFNAQGDVQAVFECDPPDSLQKNDDNNDPILKDILNDPTYAHEGDSHNPVHKRPEASGIVTPAQPSTNAAASASATATTTPGPASEGDTSPLANSKYSTASKSKPAETEQKGRKKSRRSIDAKLREEFADSDDDHRHHRHHRHRNRNHRHNNTAKESDAGKRDDVRVGSGGAGGGGGGGEPSATHSSPEASIRKIKKPLRKDSLIDYEDPNVGAQEANARLSSMERRLTRIELLLERLLNNAADQDVIDERDSARDNSDEEGDVEQLRNDILRETGP